MNKESCVFYKSFYDAIKNVPKESQLELYNAVFEYSFNDTIPDFTDGIAKAMFILMKPNIDSANARYRASVENGKKGGRPSKKNPKEPNKNPDKTQQKPNKNLNDNVDVDDNDNYNDNINDNDVSSSVKKNSYEIIISYLNEKTNSKYRASNKSTQKHINARLKEGYTVEDFKTVIDNKYIEWFGTNMEQYLRPETLFGTKFESYLNAKVIRKETPPNKNNGWCFTPNEDSLDDLF